MNKSSQYPFNLVLDGPAYFAEKCWEEWLSNCMKNAKAFSDLSAKLWEVPLENKRLKTAQEVTAATLYQIEWMVSRVRPGASLDEFVGDDMNLLAAWRFYKLSGDGNGVHLRFSRSSWIAGYRPMAHGWYGVVQGVAGLMLHHKTKGFVPKMLDVEFHKPVILGEDSLSFTIADGEGPMLRVVTIYARNRTGKRRVGKIFVLLRPGEFEAGELASRLAAGCYASAALAEFSPGCGFYSFSVDFSEEEHLLGTRTVELQGIGRDKRGMVSIVTRVKNGSFNSSIADGLAVIVPT